MLLQDSVDINFWLFFNIPVYVFIFIFLSSLRLLRDICSVYRILFLIYYITKMIDILLLVPEFIYLLYHEVDILVSVPEFIYLFLI